LALLSGWSGIDFSQLDPDQPLEYIETNAVRTLLQSFTQADPDRRWTMRDLAKFVGIGGGGPVLVGTPEQLVDMFMEWIREGVDGFNLAYAITPGTFVDFIEEVAPVLQRRGLMQSEYQEGTFREKLFGQGRARLQPPHPAAQSRRSVE
jgi:alkanesulfonate monooxygenase SsuD/methylene tetrahydromethanopterin reductase-like flavin-dependent oxidoreductase (luciferase family)